MSAGRPLTMFERKTVKDFVVSSEMPIFASNSETITKDDDYKREHSKYSDVSLSGVA